MSSILTSQEDGFDWIRCEGKCSFQNSPILKELAASRIDAGVRTLVVDLQACTGMDSTFMGTLAGLALRLAKLPEGVLQIAEPGTANRKSLEDLGLGVIIDIEPAESLWGGSTAEVRERLREYQSGSGQDANRPSHVLEAHRRLSDLNEENSVKFKTVLDVLEGEASSQDRF
ncbi:STAS domain-containing protein [Persicirhabdus sediminis]|uniref:STAS domain-containing protein n=1 Tax=Persicirhabdus sediminis TaxID=454144 RepID=A0A8J7SK28_9BACT|nr:STAS domain-containing protein [Persicirhabdus sediminis]MBK1792570.1 STAS domain-containing protein [Persicirhabdus sediminis]